MFRTWFSNFWKNNKEKIKQASTIIIILILVLIAVTSVFNSLTNKNNDKNVNNIYTPTQTVISGSDVKEEDFQDEDNLVKEFVDYCNSGNISDAYNLLTENCKEKMFPTEQAFKEKYYNIIFEQKREYNLQSWINETKYHTYKLRFTEDIIANGNYDNSDKYEDYITIVKDKENNQSKKLNINSYIKTENVNKKTNLDELEIEVTSIDIYMNYTIYYLDVKNSTNKDILLDTLNDNNNIKLIGTNDASYKLDRTNLRVLDLKVGTNNTKNIKLEFLKQQGSDVSGKSIKIKKVITDYSLYRENNENYNEYKEITIKL